MKKTILLLIISLCSIINIQAQLHFSTSAYQRFAFNDITQKWSPMSNATEEVSFLEINNDVTLLKITSPSKKIMRLTIGNEISRTDGTVAYFITDFSGAQGNFLYSKKDKTITLKMYVDKKWSSIMYRISSTWKD